MANRLAAVSPTAFYGYNDVVSLRYCGATPYFFNPWQSLSSKSAIDCHFSRLAPSCRGSQSADALEAAPPDQVQDG